MGTSTRYSSATDLPHTIPGEPDIADASGSSPISANHSDDLLLAIARVEASLRTVLAAIRVIQLEMGITQKPTPDVPLKPDNSWIGTP